MKKNKFRKVVLFGAVTQMLCLQGMNAIAQTSTATQPPANTTVPALSTSAPSIGGVPNLSVMDPQSAPPDCNKEIMQNLNSKYLENRGLARIQQYNNQMNGLVLTTPKANQMDCFQQAMQNIKNLMNAINSIIAMFSGQIDMDSIMQQMVNMVLKAACQEINQVTGSISGSLNGVTSGINGTINGINNTPLGSGSMGTTVGNVLGGTGGSNSGSTDIVSGTVSGINNTVGNVGSAASSAGSKVTDLVNGLKSISPFGSSN